MVYRGGIFSKRKKKLGQHFLIDDRVVLEVYHELEKLDKNSIIIETGAGCGAITQQICKLNSFIVAIEIDREFCRILKSKLREQENVDVICADVLKIKFPENSIIVGAPPYNITTSLLTKCIIHNIKSAVLVLQKEVCEKITQRGRKGKFSYLSRFISTFAEVKLGRKVEKSSFFPQPSVDSQIIVIRVNKRREIKRNIREEYLIFLRALFEKFKRKKIKEAVKAGLIPYKTVGKEEMTKRVFEVPEEELFNLFLRRVGELE